MRPLPNLEAPLVRSAARVEPLAKPVLFLMLAFALVLAGCADNAGPGGADGGDGNNAATSMTNAEAESLLKKSAGSFPERFGFEMKAFTATDAEAMVATGAVDNTTGETLMTIRGDPKVLAPSQDGEGGEDEGTAALFQEGFTIYATKSGSLYYANGTAYVFPADGGTDGFVPNPEDNPLTSMANPTMFLESVDDESWNVTSVKPTTHRGKAAVEIAFTAKGEDSEEGDEVIQGTAIVYAANQRVAKFEGRTEATTADEPNRFVMEFFYDDEVKMTPPEAVSRSLGLAYESDSSPFGGGTENADGSTTVTWTFQSAMGLPLADVEVLAFDAAKMDSGSTFDFGAHTPSFAMKLSDGSHDEGTTKVVFTDADSSGTVTKGDTLAFTTTDESPSYTFVLRDTKTGTYVVPGAAAWMLLAGLGAAAFLARRK